MADTLEPRTGLTIPIQNSGVWLLVMATLDPFAAQPKVAISTHGHGRNTTVADHVAIRQSPANISSPPSPDPEQLASRQSESGRWAIPIPAEATDLCLRST
ncbi:hypothetical protein A9K55_005423 [Cordyceps militaris]|uniref:Uncharacterized protein n=1 Tax=Cordyceps militaris TaxID=73501 RepID=A0A2H4SA26_CORMI|nr:hypothetical protein A9K55_005423 [Cordyceps militaris]